jgi:hypothetical protein
LNSRHASDYHFRKGQTRSQPGPGLASQLESGGCMFSESIQSASARTTVIPRPSTPQEALLCSMELPLHRIFFPLGYPVEIITNDPAVLDAASESFGHHHSRETGRPLQLRIGVSDGDNSESPSEPVRREYNHLFSLVADAGNQALLDLDLCTGFVWVKKDTVQHRLYFRYNFLEKPIYVLLGSSVVTDLHAACVSLRGKGILLCGESGAGKSSLAYACARAGWTYTSDDTSYLINSSKVPRVFGHSHRMRFRPTAKDLFPELNNRGLAPRLEGKPSIEVPTSEFPGLITASEARVHSIVYLRRSPLATGRLVALPDGTAIQRMSRELYSAGDIRARQESALQVLSATPAFELHYHGLEHAMEQLDLLTRTP